MNLLLAIEMNEIDWGDRWSFFVWNNSGDCMVLCDDTGVCVCDSLRHVIKSFVSV